jgi:hypothetical protein
MLSRDTSVEELESKKCEKRSKEEIKDKESWNSRKY